ncbi:stage VI sporulation protein F [Paenibacillus melissococcoides]|uniref:Stage VI sporulation protein F n=1 Tax=Paenibacillus melissococcoides TaxID=2912268 RepID=A0ABN8UBA9_9BACL|nr:MULTISPECIES: stage VI sporulation protein F [Paenibacillus]MEB9897021.1 stage VI sporulation protein F [Bacillus cereus]MBG9793942.1 serine/threonine protein kinase [Paenibacillus dendritiformis]CAH8247312.1 stage VI sporulation protein F [Paenibacillus melissococcoides]CAH8717336.1 stage VI sporulation protein F [Paenibacillus melissococcoides]CAH8718323.1 stage VI sporulation protein F [Paenibacillus melissococcoides]
MSYTKYGISPQLVERIKLKMKQPALKERVKQIVDGVTKADLQNRQTVRRLLRKIASALNENISAQQEEAIVHFVLAQKIDPNNTFHLLKLWGMFR